MHAIDRDATVGRPFGPTSRTRTWHWRGSSSGRRAWLLRRWRSCGRRGSGRRRRRSSRWWWWRDDRVAGCARSHLAACRAVDVDADWVGSWCGASRRDKVDRDDEAALLWIARNRWRREGLLRVVPVEVEAVIGSWRNVRAAVRQRRGGCEGGRRNARGRLQRDVYRCGGRLYRKRKGHHGARQDTEHQLQDSPALHRGEL